MNPICLISPLSGHCCRSAEYGGDQIAVILTACARATVFRGIAQSDNGGVPSPSLRIRSSLDCYPGKADVIIAEAGVGWPDRFGKDPQLGQLLHPRSGVPRRELMSVRANPAWQRLAGG